jgi:valyl-tRNA synthetase
MSHLDLPSRWIISRFHATLANVNQALEQYRFSEAENLIYDFFWGHFCDWYLELIKQRFNNPDVQKTACYILENSLRMIHPFMPFVTEEIWQHLNLSTECLSKTSWPQVHPEASDQDAEQAMTLLMEIITAVRNSLAQWRVHPGHPVPLIISVQNESRLKILRDNIDVFHALLKTESLTLETKWAAEKNTACGVVQDIKFFIPLEGMIDIEKERGRMTDEIAQIQKAVTGIEGRLKNKEFLKKAPADVVAKDRERLTEFTIKLRQIQETVNNFQ